MLNSKRSFHMGLNPAGVDYCSDDATQWSIDLNCKSVYGKNDIVVMRAMLTIVINVVCLLGGIVCRDTEDLHSYQRVHDGFAFVLVEFR